MTAAATRTRWCRFEWRNSMPLRGMPRPRSSLRAWVRERGAAEGAAAEPGAPPAGPSTTDPDAGCSDEFVAFAARVGGERGGVGLRRDESLCRSGQSQNTFWVIRKQ